MPIEAIIAIVVVLAFLIMWGSRDRRTKPDWETWRLYRKRKHWHTRSPGDRGRSIGSRSFSIQIDGMDTERNRRLNELIAERDVVSAAALLEAEGYEGAEAIDRAERYTGREHPEADTRGYPAAYAKPEGSSGGGFFGASGPPRRIGFEQAGRSRASRSEVERKVRQQAAPEVSADEFEATLHILLAQEKKLEAIKLYREHHRTDLRTAKEAVDALDKTNPRPRG